MTDNKIAFTIEEASEYTGIGRNTMRNLVEWNKLPVLKVGRKVLVKKDILETFMIMNEGRNLRDKSDVKAVTRKTVFQERALKKTFPVYATGGIIYLQAIGTILCLPVGYQ